VLAKARLESLPELGLVRACAAVGGAESGFADVGAYPAVSAADGASVVVLEFGNLKRSPLSRSLAVLDIEALRFGGRLGQTTILSHVPLDALLDVLKFNTGLDASTTQVLETHLPNEEPR
jgi:glutamate formiminotransferase